MIAASPQFKVQLSKNIQLKASVCVYHCCQPCTAVWAIYIQTTHKQAVCELDVIKPVFVCVCMLCWPAAVYPMQAEFAWWAALTLEREEQAFAVQLEVKLITPGDIR